MTEANTHLVLLTLRIGGGYTGIYGKRQIFKSSHRPLFDAANYLLSRAAGGRGSEKATRNIFERGGAFVRVQIIPFGQKPRSRYFPAQMSLKPIPFEVYRQGTAPEPPATLGVLGSNLWRQILTENDIPDTARLTILEQACAMLDRAENLRR